MEQLKKSIGEHLKGIRESAGKSVAQLARDLKKNNDQFVHDIEKGNKKPTLETIIKYYKIFDKSFEELLSPILEIQKKNEELKSIIKKLEKIQDFKKQWQGVKILIDSVYKEIISILPKKTANNDSQIRGRVEGNREGN